jgi:hypothetical protein
MSEPTQSPFTNPTATPAWPPTPGGMPSASAQADDIRQFPVQSEWLVLLFMLITLGIYAPFWIIRTTRIINRILPENPIPDGMVWLLIPLLIVNLVLAFASGALMVANPTLAQLLSHISNIYSWAVTIYYWVIIFRVQGLLNKILEQTSPNLGKFNGVGTFFFGPIYLQAAINNRIKDLNTQFGVAI